MPLVVKLCEGTPRTDPRHRNTVGLMICGTSALLEAIITHVLDDCPIAFAGSRMLAATLAFMFAAVLALSSCPRRVSSFIVMVAITMWNSVMIWGLVALDGMLFASIVNDLVVVVQLLTMIAGLELTPTLLCTGMNAINFVAVCKLKEVDFNEMAATGSACSIIFTFIVMYHQQMERNAIEKANKEIESEQEATKALLDMICDAGFMLADDGDTVVRGGPRLDAIMGTSMDGAKIMDYMTLDEQERFRGTVSGGTGSMDSSTFSSSTSCPVKLLPVTLLCHRGQRVKAEFFIVDRRSQDEHTKHGPFGFGGNKSSMGFLIGLRLSDEESGMISFNSEVAHPQEEGISEENLPMPMPTLRQASSSAEAPCGMLRRYSESEPDIELGSSVASVSQPTTLASRRLETLQVQPCARSDICTALLGGRPRTSGALGQTLRTAINLIADHTSGGAMVLIASADAFKRVFVDAVMDRQPSGRALRGAPALQSADRGYMDSRLRGLHVSDPRFTAAFDEFTQRGVADRWPEDHPDPAARNLPKDGALLLDERGFRLKSACKLLGLAPVRMWPGVGTKHEAAMSAVWAIDGCIALVRSDSGSVHGLVRDGVALRAYYVAGPDVEQVPVQS